MSLPHKTRKTGTIGPGDHHRTTARHPAVPVARRPAPAKRTSDTWIRSLRGTAISSEFDPFHIHTSAPPPGAGPGPARRAAGSGPRGAGARGRPGAVRPRRIKKSFINIAKKSRSARSTLTFRAFAL